MVALLAIGTLACGSVRTADSEEDPFSDPDPSTDPDPDYDKEDGSGCVTTSDIEVLDYDEVSDGFDFAPSELIDFAEGSFEGQLDVNGGLAAHLDITVSSVHARNEIRESSSSSSGAGAPVPCAGLHYAIALDVSLTTPGGEFDEHFEDTVQVNSPEFARIGDQHVPTGTFEASAAPGAEYESLFLETWATFEEDHQWHVDLRWFGTTTDGVHVEEDIPTATFSAVAATE